MTTTFKIEGMHCGACVGRVRTALAAAGFVADVTLTPPQIVLAGAARDARSAVQAAVASAGKYRLGDEVAAVPAAMLMPIDVAPEATVAGWLATYRPLLLIAGYLAVASFAGTGMATTGRFDAAGWMTNFMAGFFLVFSFFKLLDLAGFADAYSTYDLLAQRWRVWGLIYPFVELALGLAYLFRLWPTLTNVVTLALMLFGSLGVLAALRRRQTIRCACLGTVLNLPMSTITLVEDLGMAAMAAVMLIAAH
jgi:copper chaperone CopZ